MSIRILVPPPPRTSLLGLPVELRINIYGNISPMLDDHFGAYKGLYLSCRQIHDELKEEAAKRMNKYLSGIQEDWKKTYKSVLRLSLTGIKNVNVSIPLSHIYHKLRFHGPLVALLPLKISRLSISFYNDNPDADPPDSESHMDFLCEIDKILGEKIQLLTHRSKEMEVPYRLGADQLRIEYAPGDWLHGEEIEVDDAISPASWNIELEKSILWHETKRAYGWRTPPRWKKEEIVWDKLTNIEYGRNGKVVDISYARDLH